MPSKLAGVLSLLLNALREGQDDCADQHDACAAWARSGECDANGKYMRVHCPKSCASCDWAVAAVRCALDPAAISAVAPGDMDAMFARLETSAAFAAYKPRVLSREPWLVVLDELLTRDEADAIAAVATREGGRHFEASRDTRGAEINALSDRRTSSTQWCSDGCANETAVALLRARVATITGVPLTHAEPPQLLRYEPGEYYRLHSDYIPVQRELPCGPRVYTAFVYLSDVEAGGQTTFPQLRLQVEPRKGRAVLWPSTRNAAPAELDVRTIHQAEPVVAGVKLSANLWLHTHDYMAAVSRSCTGGLARPPPSAEPPAARAAPAAD
jgi:prolyl 4-hydroxylase